MTSREFTKLLNGPQMRRSVGLVILLVAAGMFSLPGCREAAHVDSTGESVTTETPATTTARLESATTADEPAVSAPPTPRSVAVVEVAQQVDREPGTATPAEPEATPSEAQLARHGLRRLDGRHLTLITDLPQLATIDELPAVFDKAVAHWSQYFDIDSRRLAGWRVTACLMKEESPFRATGLLPSEMPAFENGYATRRRIWLFEQASDYYRRHLLLHEGTHSFMYEMFGTCGPSWYMEGVAELLATHRWKPGALRLGVYPERRQDFPLLGRIRMVQDEVTAGRMLTIDEILRYDGEAFLSQLPYGWSWALCSWLENHPRYRQRFGKLRRALNSDSADDATPADLNDLLLRLTKDDRKQLNLEWTFFCREIDQGHDFARAAVDFRPARSLDGRRATVEVAADRGWQSSGLRVAAGQAYRLTATGRYQVAQDPQIWWCEPDGVTLEYHRGRPLGQLMVTIVAEDRARPAVHEPLAVGSQRTWQPAVSGVAYFRINESSAKLADNAGNLTVTMFAAADN